MQPFDGMDRPATLASIPLRVRPSDERASGPTYERWRISDGGFFDGRWRVPAGQPGDVLAIIKARADTAATAERSRVIVQQIYNHAIRNLLVTTNPT